MNKIFKENYTKKNKSYNKKFICLFIYKNKKQYIKSKKKKF